MVDYNDYTTTNTGKQVLITTIKGRIEGTLLGTKSDEEGNVESLTVKQYLHKLDVPVNEILNVRLI